MRKLKKYQYNVISRFCEDLSKGMVLAIILGQATNVSDTFWGNIFSILISLTVSLLILSLAVYFSKEGK